MAQYYTLDEAAQKLGLSTDDFRRRLATEWKSSPRRYPDGATLRFQSREIDELARTLGRGSDPDLLLGDSSDENLPIIGLAPDDDALTVSKGPKAPADSGISLEKSSSEFELQIEDSGTKKEKDSAVRKKKSSGKIPPPAKPDDSDSEFELSMDAGGPGLVEEEAATTAFQTEEEQKDIFETDFELPTLDDESGSSEQAAVDEGSSDTDLESSDFDLALDEGDAAAEEESGSQVVALDEDEAPRARRRMADGSEEDLDELDVADDVELEAEEAAEDEEGELEPVAAAP